MVSDAVIGHPKVENHKGVFRVQDTKHRRQHLCCCWVRKIFPLPFVLGVVVFIAGSVFINVGSVDSAVGAIVVHKPQADEPQLEAYAEISDAKQPQLAVDSAGNVYCAFGRGNRVYVSRCQEGTAAEPVLVGQLEKLALGRRRGPRICIAGETLIVSAISHQTGQVVSWRSVDQGKNWSQPVVVNTAAGDDANDNGQQSVALDSAKEGLHAMAATASGDRVVCLWLDFRNQKMELYAAVSLDGGDGWGENIKVYAAPEKNICECCHPSLAFDSEGGLHVMWRNSIDGKRDMYRLYSKDLVNFTKAHQLGILSWELDQCPMDGGSIAAVSAKQYYTVWRRENIIYRSSGPAKEDAFGVGQQPVVTLVDDQPHYVWIGSEGQLKWSTPERFAALEVAQKAHEPVAVAIGGDLLIAYETQDEDNQPLVKIVKLNLKQ